MTGLSALGLAACDPAQPTAPAADTTPSETQAASAITHAKGTGTVTAIDSAAGKITLDHGPIAELQWPAMTMAFDAPPALLTAVKIGDQVSFDLDRSEEHTSELQSLMRISYAVFCLKKKITTPHTY